MGVALVTIWCVLSPSVTHTHTHTESLQLAALIRFASSQRYRHLYWFTRYPGAPTR